MAPRWGDRNHCARRRRPERPSRIFLRAHLWASPSTLCGFFVQEAQGGLLPRKVRRELIVNLLKNFADTVNEAFPGPLGEQLFDGMTQTIEKVGRRAVSFAPSRSDVWSAPVIAQALSAIANEDPRLECRLSIWQCRSRLPATGTQSERIRRRAMRLTRDPLNPMKAKQIQPTLP